MSNIKIKVIAFYLPQFHPIPENNEWWGKGFTEWTNVAKAKPLFHGHYQPKIPADLGFYDLRLPVIREEQAELAKEAGISAFCYWNYWFGNGKMLLNNPLQSIIESGQPNFPFCLAWANHTWFKKQWNNKTSILSKEVLIEQVYPGEKDIYDHFYTMLPAFMDKRYYKIQGRLVFVIYDVKEIPYLKSFVDIWQNLALKNDLPGFYFIAHSFNIENINNEKFTSLDAINMHLLHDAFQNSRNKRILSFILKRPLNIIDYSYAMKYWESDLFKINNIIPSIYPNWDTTPRIGSVGSILQNSNPTVFKKHVDRIFNLIKDKESENRIVFLKSWNEWAEGNYMEPDLKYGKGYIKALKQSLDDFTNLNK